MTTAFAHSPAKIAAEVLRSLAVGTDPATHSDWPIYISGEPSAPDNVITVYDVSGPYQGRTSPDGEMAGPAGIQFRVRGKTYDVAWVKVASLFNLLQASDGGTRRVSITLDGHNYVIQCFSKISKIVPLGKETPTSVRRIFTINCLMTVSACT